MRKNEDDHDDEYDDVEDMLLRRRACWKSVSLCDARWWMLRPMIMIELRWAWIKDVGIEERKRKTEKKMN